ncbi:MAG: sulfatase [Opitutales bacterium]|nr:sulfatase [Opitutales bacterium]
MMKNYIMIATASLCAAFAQAETSVLVETASSSSGFKELAVPLTSHYGQPSFDRKVTSNHTTSNDPLRVLTDGRLAEEFGPIFANNVSDGAYKMDLGAVRAVSTITSWSHNQVGRRGAQKLTIYGSDGTTDPGWDLSQYAELGKVDTGAPNATFTAASLRDSSGGSLGSFRWIVWAVSPSAAGENTAYQEFAVDAEPTKEEKAFAAIKRPNIVFLLTDDQRWDTLGCYGRTDVITPNIDKLAAQGVAFDNAFYAVAICMPSRATMFTGRYFSDHQSGFTYPYNRALTKEEFTDSYPAKLKDVGYRTGFVGKFGIRLEGSNQTAIEHFDYFVSGNNPVTPKDDPGLKDIYRKDRPANERTLKKGDAMIRFLETQPEGQPFCLSISFDAVKNDRDSDMYPPHVEVLKDMQMWVPPNWVEGKSERLPKLLDYCRGTYLHVARTSTPDEYQRRTRRFAVQGYTVDKQVERLMAKLEEMGVLDNTIVIYTSDNGRFHGSQGLFDKAILYEESMKQPLIVFDGRAPKSQHGKRVDAMVSSVDVAPTILSLAGLEVPERMKGVDLSGLLAGTQDMSEWRDSVLMENFFIQEIHSAGIKKHPDIPALNQEIIAGNRSYRTQGVRTERFKYFKYHEHDPVIEELYDLEADPYEQNNLISNPEYAEVLSRLQQKTEQLITEATE